MTAISKRQRIEAAISGEIADRLPTALWRHFPVDDQDPQNLARVSADFQRTYDFDFLKVTPASSFCLKDWGVGDEWRGHHEGTRDYTRRVIHEPSDWRKLTPLDADRGQLGAQLECLRLLINDLGPEVPLVQTVFSPLSQAKNLAGNDRLLAHLRQAPEEVLAGLETIAASTLGFLQALEGLGIAGIFFAVQHASYSMFDRASYWRFGGRHDQQILEAAAGLWLNVLHMHGSNLIFDVVSELPAQVVNWHDRVDGPSLPVGKQTVRGAVCGGLSQWETVTLGDPEAVRREAEEAIASMDGRGMLLGVGCVVPIIAPAANLHAVRRAVDGA